jgi:hypothetical protein
MVMMMMMMMMMILLMLLLVMKMMMMISSICYNFRQKYTRGLGTVYNSIHKRRYIQVKQVSHC